jgi:hypothetical protein
LTRKKERPIPTDEDLVRDFGGQEFRRFVVENWPGKKPPRRADVERYVRFTLMDARLYISDAVKPEQKTTEKMMSPVREAAATFTRNHQLMFYQVTGYVPPYTASRTFRDPFMVILRECLRLLRGPVDDIAFLNKLQDRSHILTDRRGQPRRKRKSSKPIPE